MDAFLSVVNTIKRGPRVNRHGIVANDEGQLGVFVETFEKKRDVVFVSEELHAAMVPSGVQFFIRRVAVRPRSSTDRRAGDRRAE
jgi:hypothetical protein